MVVGCLVVNPLSLTQQPEIRDIVGRPDFQKMKQATVEIKVGKPGGAGVIVKEDKEYLYILTAKHIINNQGKVRVRLLTTSTERPVVEIDRKLITTSSNVDLALIKVPKPKGEFVVLKIAEENKPQIGDKIYTIGHPVGTRFTVNEGLLSNYTAKTYGGRQAQYILISAPSFNGNSGGAVVNTETELIGIAVGIFYIGQDWRDIKHTLYLCHMTYCVKIADINKLLQKSIK